MFINSTIKDNLKKHFQYLPTYKKRWKYLVIKQQELWVIKNPQNFN